MKSVADLPLGQSAIVRDVNGQRAFRRRLLEMGLVPGTQIKVVTVAPLGDPLQIEVRGGQWSIRRNEASQIEVESIASARTAETATPGRDGVTSEQDEARSAS